jgi:desulfoferrodoxin (superoxide reductase-like protein)
MSHTAPQPNAPQLLTRRSLLALASAGAGAAALGGCMGDSSYNLDRETLTQWAVRADALEANGVYTAAVPGKWAGKEAGHAPSAQVMVMGGATLVQAFVNHVMTPEHWISGVYFRDQNNQIFYLQELAYTDGDEGVEKGVTVYAEVPAGVTTVTAYAYCNLHDCWMGVPVSVAVGG